MEQIQPWFYHQFQCIAQACSDTCCAGWEIYIDDDSLARYEADTSDFGRYRLSKIVKTEEGAQFALGDNQRCPFLTAENLCAMIVAQGEQSLCHICTHHPRFYNAYGPYDEQGIGLCCPEGSRLLLSQPLTFMQKYVPDDSPDDPMADTVFHLRGLLQEVLLDRELSLAQRCEEALSIAQQAQTQLYDLPQVCGATLTTKSQLWGFVLEHMMALLPINQDWQRYLQHLNGQLPALLAGEGAFIQSPACHPHAYGDVAAYVLYRQFPKGLEDGQLVARLGFALLSTLFVHICYLDTWLQTGDLEQERRVAHLKNWSKQVEYCDENTQLFLQSCQGVDLLQCALFDGL